MTKKALSRAEFNTLAQQEQLNILYRDGVHIGKRTVDDTIVILYQLYSFYVEVYFKEYRKEVSRMITSEDTDLLQSYLHQVRIRDLDNNKEKE